MSAEIPAGAMRFNSDSQKLEYWNGSAWFQVHTATPNLASAGDPTPGARGLFNGGQESPTTTVNKIEYINIASTGNAVDFGDLTRNAKNAAACASSVTGVVAGGESFNNIIEKYTIASTGSCVDSGGNLSSATQYSSGLSNSTRGIFALGYIPGPGNVDTLEYITISSIGNSVDFGNLQLARRASGTCASPTRGIIAGGIGPSGVNIIDFVAIATLGNGQDFGDLLNTQWDGAGLSNPTRGLWGGGATPTDLSTIQYVNISSTGNSIKFGDLSVTRRQTAGCSSSIRGVWGGGEPYTDTIDYVNITTEGDAVDFGNLSSNRTWIVGCSNAHGGL